MNTIEHRECKTCVYYLLFWAVRGDYGQCIRRPGSQEDRTVYCYAVCDHYERDKEKQETEQE